MTRVMRRAVALVGVTMMIGATGCGHRPPRHYTTSSTDTTIPTETTASTDTTTPTGKVPCMILRGTMLPGTEKDVPVMRMDPWPPVQIATMHLPGEIWSPPEAKDLCL